MACKNRFASHLFEQFPRILGQRQKLQVLLWKLRLPTQIQNFSSIFLSNEELMCACTPKALANQIRYLYSQQQIIHYNMSQLSRLRETIELSRNITDGVQRIDLYSKKVGDTGVRCLREFPWKNIRSIQLSFNDIWSDGAFQISRLGYDQLQCLYLDGNKITDKGLEFIVSAEWKGLKVLSIANNEVGSQGAKKFLKSNWPNLQRLNLDSNQIGYEGVKYFSQIRWNNLKQLLLWNCGLGKKGVKYLSKCDWRQLQVVWLGANQLTDEALHYLAKSDWPNLLQLNLSQNCISRKGVQYLLKKDVRKLKNLLLSQHILMDRGVQKDLMRLECSQLQRLYLNCEGSQFGNEQIRAQLKERFLQLFYIQI